MLAGGLELVADAGDELEVVLLASGRGAVVIPVLRDEAEGEDRDFP